MERKAYPSDVSDDEWSFIAPYLILMKEDAPQREYDLREVFNGLGWIVPDVDTMPYEKVRDKLEAIVGNQGVIQAELIERKPERHCLIAQKNHRRFMVLPCLTIRFASCGFALNDSLRSQRI